MGSPKDDDALRGYEEFMERQWMRDYINSKAIKHSKDTLSADNHIPRLLDSLHVY